MTALYSTAVSAILSNYADVIEGGSAYATGTVYTGIPGTQSHHELSGETVTAEAGSTTTSIAAANTFGNDRFVTTASPPWFLIGLTGTAGNVGAARKISDVSSSAFTVAAFPATPAADDTYALREGFKRAPDNYDIESEEEADDNFDRFFHLSMLPGKRMPWYGNCIETYEAELSVRLRLLKHVRARKVADSALENVLLLRSVLTRPEYRDGTYTQMVLVEETEPEVVVDTARKVVVVDRYRLLFRVGAEIL